MSIIDDASFFEIIEAFLRDDNSQFDGETSSASSTSGGDEQLTVSDTESQTKLKKPPAMNRSRIRLRMELLSLREQVVALESELMAAQRGNSDLKKSGAPNAAALRALVKCQAERLRASEQERQELRVQVRECKRVIRRVQRFLLAQKVIGLEPEIRYNIRVVKYADSRSQGFETIARHLEWMYEAKYAFFTKRRFESLSKNGYDRHILFDRTSSMSVEVFASRLLPFNVEETATALWEHHLTKTTRTTTAVDEDRIDEDDSIRRSFIAKFAFPTFIGSGRGHMETRRFIEGDRVVMLQCTVHTVSNDSIRVEGLGVRVSTWTIIEPPREQNLHSARKNVCRLSTFEQRELVFSGPEAIREGAHARDEIRRYCLDGGDYVLDLERHGVECILLAKK